MNRSTPGLPVHHQLLGFTQTHVHRVGDAIQPSHPLSSPSPPAPNPSHLQGLFQWVSSSHEVAQVLEFQLQHQSFHYCRGLQIFEVIRYLMSLVKGFPDHSAAESPPVNARDVRLVPELKRSPGGGNGNPLQCSGLGNPTEGGIWWAIVRGVARDSNMT